MIAASWPRPADIRAHYGRMVEALLALDRQRFHATQDAKSAFFGKPSDEVDALLAKTRDGSGVMWGGLRQKLIEGPVPPRAAAVLAVLGCLSNRYRPQGPSRLKPHKGFTALGLSRPDRFGNLVDVVVKLLRKSVTNGTYFIHDGVRMSHDVYSSISSIGVQISGGSKPAPRQTSSILPRIVALAMWAQFQVSRKFIPCTAASAM